MPERQLWIFRLGCWTAFAVAALHLVLHVWAAPLPADVQRLDAVPPPAVIAVPGLLQPRTSGVLAGFSLAVGLFAATMGAAGLVLVKRTTDVVVLRGVARAFALGATGLLLLAILDFFSVLTFAIAAMALCFAMATVSEG
jgi:hypothetical protein